MPPCRWFSTAGFPRSLSLFWWRLPPPVARGAGGNDAYTVTGVDVDVTGADA